jgi:U3 small nucleolar ribonucleoprotein protein IMP4
MKKEYLIKKEQEYKEKELESKKSKVLDCLDTTTKLSYDLRKEGKNILEEIIYNQKLEDVDYRLPKILVTTSKDPSSKLIQFAKHLSLILSAQHQIRGSMSEEEISDMAHRLSYTCVILVYESKGVPSTLTISSFPFGDTLRFKIYNFSQINRLQNLGEKSYLIVDNFETEIGLKIKKLFSLFFPKCDNAKRILTLANRDDRIAFRHYLISKGKKTEINLDFGCDLQLFEIRKGTFEQDGDLEWVYRPHLKSGKSNKVLTAVKNDV